MASPTKLARDNTMEATAKEGIEFLEKASPDLAEKCKDLIKETTENGSGDAPEVTKNGNSPTKLTRDNTMVTTAEEGLDYLRRQGAHDVIALHGLDKLKPQSKRTTADTKPPLIRDRTMVATAKEGKEFVEKQGGVNAEAKTRAQEAELNNSASENDDKSATKRPAQEEQQTEVDDAKKQKTEEENNDNVDGEKVEEKSDDTKGAE